MRPLLELELTLLADYFQFYLQDEGSSPALSEWTPAELHTLLSTSRGVVVVGTARNMPVPVKIAVFAAEPDFLAGEPGPASLINECALEVRSGKIIVAGLLDYQPDAVRIAVAPGMYRVRIYYANLEALSEDGLEGADTYTVQLWPTTSLAGTVCRQSRAA